jgi:quercetin dioxygenase-like cupin family protein
MIRAILLAAAAAAAAAPAATPIQTHAEFDVPRGKPQKVIVQSRDFAPGAESGWHIHPGIEVAYVVEGQLTVQAGDKVSVLNVGDSFTMPRGVAHNGINRGDKPARAVITLVVDKGAQPRQPVKAPKGG